MNQTLAKRKPLSRSMSPFRNFFPNSMFDEFFDQYMNSGNPELAEMMNATMDVAETEQAFEVKMDLPGVGAGDVDIQIDNNTLTVRGSRNEESEEKDEDKKFHRIERCTGSFARSVVLPNSINEDETAAEFKDGVLKIVIPKTEDAKPRKIRINN